MPSASQTKDIPPRGAPGDADDARERLVRTAYELFTANGVTTVGVDRIVAEAGVAKTTLYRHFRSKEALVVATLAAHDELMTSGWLEPELIRRASTPAERLLTVFDLLEEWFRQPTYRGCLFVNTVLEIHDRSSEVRAAALEGIERIYGLVRQLAGEAGARDPDALAHQLQVLMRGSFVAGVEGRLEAVRHARDAARRLVEASLAAPPPAL